MSAYTVINTCTVINEGVWILLHTNTARYDTDILIFILKRFKDTNLWLGKLCC